MASFSLAHWLIFFSVFMISFGGPALGIFRSVQNSSFANAALSAYVPFYGLIYFVAARRRQGGRASG